MNTIKNKLHSQRGASLLFALLFLLFCVLVGGTVLAAASANGFRITRMQEKQQELEERSAAKMVADQLDMGEQFFSVTITSTVEKQSASAAGQKTIEVKLQEGVTLTPMQRLTVEMAVWKYLKDYGGDAGSVVLTNFVCSDGASNSQIISMDSFWYKYNLNSAAAFTGTVKLAGTNLVNKEVEFSLKDNYDLAVNLGAGSHLTVQMKAEFSPGEEETTPFGSGGSRTTRTSNIWWEDPLIKKESA